VTTLRFGLTAGSALQLGLVAEVSRLPQETMVGAVQAESSGPAVA
jgi:hypothetical protein